MGNNNKRFKRKKPIVQDNYKPPFPAEVLQRPVTDLKLREDTLKLLTDAHVVTLYDVAKRTEKDFYKIHTFNKKNLLDVKNAIKAFGIHLKPMEEKPAEENAEKKAPDGISGDKNKTNGGQKGNGAGKNNNRDKKKPSVDESFVMTCKIERPPKPKIVPVKEEPDLYVKISRGGKWGFKNRNGKQVVEPIYDEVFNFKEDLCCVEKDGLFGFINREGEEVIPIEYDCATSFSEGYACVFKKEKCGYIDVHNNVVVDFKFDAATPVIGGECRVKRDGKWGEMHLIKSEDGTVTTSDIRWIN